MKKLNKLSIVGYGAGDAANNLAFTTATMFLLVYYTDVAGISAAAAGTLLLVVRLFDAFADVLAGRIVDGATASASVNSGPSSCSAPSRCSC
ncbi:MAG TPA: MFS transporter [Chloroflexota bacterium]|jgi:glucuronide carrier protein